MRTKAMQWLASLLVLLMSALVAAVVWQVLSRYLLASPSVWTEELARFLLIWIGVLGSVYAYYTRSHLTVDLLSERLGEAGRQRLEALQSAFVAIFALTAMVIGGVRLVWITWLLDQTSPALGVPMAMVYAVVPLSGGLLLWLAAHNVLVWHRSGRALSEVADG